MSFSILRVFSWGVRDFKNLQHPVELKKKLFWLEGAWYSNWPAWAHGFNTKIGFAKYAPGPNILAKTSKIMQAWFGDPVNIFQNWFLCWNRELKPVVLSTMNPIIYRFFWDLFRVPEIFHVLWGKTPNRFKFIGITSHTPKNIQEGSAEIICEDINILSHPTLKPYPWYLCINEKM